MKPMERVEVVWVDSVQGGGWERPSDARNDATNETMLCRSSGYVLADEDDYLLLCMSYMENGESVHAPLQIPKVAVRDVLPLRKS